MHKMPIKAWFKLPVGTLTVEDDDLLRGNYVNINCIAQSPDLLDINRRIWLINNPTCCISEFNPSQAQKSSSLLPAPKGQKSDLLLTADFASIFITIVAASVHTAAKNCWRSTFLVLALEASSRAWVSWSRKMREREEGWRIRDSERWLCDEKFRRN